MGKWLSLPPRVLQEARARSDERAKQRAENIKKSEIVVPITDTRKIKKMTRKQVRALDKR